MTVASSRTACPGEGEITALADVLVYDTNVEPFTLLAVLLRHVCRIELAMTICATIELFQRRTPALIVASLPISDFDRTCFITALKSLPAPCPLIPLVDQKTVGFISALDKRMIKALHRKPVAVVSLAASIEMALGVDSGLVRIGKHTGRALELISRHYAEPGSVEDLAKAIGISAGRLAHLFRSELGSSLGEYIARVRVETAKVLCRDPALNFDEIAMRVGLYDASHLSRLFVQYAGRRPGRYRRGLGPQGTGSVA